MNIDFNDLMTWYDKGAEYAIHPSAVLSSIEGFYLTRLRNAASIEAKSLLNFADYYKAFSTGYYEAENAKWKAGLPRMAEKFRGHVDSLLEGYPTELDHESLARFTKHYADVQVTVAALRERIKEGRDAYKTHIKDVQERKDS